MKMMKFALIVLAAVTSLLALGQNPPSVGSITGIVRDPSGAAIPGVTVTATGPGGTMRVLTDERGSYVFSDIQPGTYTVTAFLTGFQPRVATLAVLAGSPTRAEFTLQVGSPQFPGAPGPLRPYPSAPNPDIRADRQTRQGTTLQYRGNVVMTTNGLELRADELDYDINSGLGDVRGNVKFRAVPSTARVIPLSH